MGGQVGAAAACAAGGSIFAECHVVDVVVCLESPVLTGQVVRGASGAGEGLNPAKPTSPTIRTSFTKDMATLPSIY